MNCWLPSLQFLKTKKKVIFFGATKQRMTIENSVFEKYTSAWVPNCSNNDSGKEYIKRAENHRREWIRLNAKRAKWIVCSQQWVIWFEMCVCFAFSLVSFDKKQTGKIMAIIKTNFPKKIIILCMNERNNSEKNSKKKLIISGSLWQIVIMIEMRLNKWN